MNNDNNLWSIVLTGGEGRRLSSFIKEAARMHNAGWMMKPAYGARRAVAA